MEDHEDQFEIISDPSAYVNMIGEYARKRTYF